MRLRGILLTLGALAGIGLYFTKVVVLHVVFERPDFSAPETQAFADDATVVPHNVSDEYLAAARAVRRAEYELAWQELERCRSDDGACHGLRGELHLIGAGVPQNLSEALKLLTAGADLGDPDSQYALGALYSNLQEDDGSGTSSGLRRQEALSVLYLYAASVSGHSGALMAMGYRHSEGYGVPKACSTAALNYIEVARRVADVYSAGMPQAVELVRLGVDGRDRKAMSASEVSLFVEIASSGDANIAAAVGKRYLLGIEGFRQNYAKAAHHLQIAAERDHATAMALLGYMHCLGLGVEKNVEVAHDYFHASVQRGGDPMGHNGLGFIYFHGTAGKERNTALAVSHFNSSAHGGSADGMFNLASMYLTGTGIEQSFQRAALWFTQALDRGHTPATYTLAVMHLNGVGTVKNCKIAVDLLKRVCERSSWVSQKLQEAYDRQRSSGHSEAAAWLFLRLAEAGHEVAQMNLAHLLDSGASRLLLGKGTDDEEEMRSLARIQAQRHYEMSAEQGNAHSELRLGDYSYYGWGLRVDDTIQEPGNYSDDIREAELGDDELTQSAFDASNEPRLVRQAADAAVSLAHYKRIVSMRPSGDWMQPFVARASFNLGYMHHFGIGAERDVVLARRYYNRCLEIDPGSVQTPVALMLSLLAFQVFLLEMPPATALARSLLMDPRTHVLQIHIMAILALLKLRRRFARLTPP
mmetsp:Transcript_136326/g.271906  ORF Transcript_136326/g.271906 Transcript_136326/m.271906 type:complete len:699 (+) Transcript_136326:78-2174(+)